MGFVGHFLVAAFTIFVSPVTALAAFWTFDGSIKEVYEDNVNPLLSAAGAPALVEGGRTAPVGVRLSDGALAQGGILGTGVGDFYTVISAAGGVASAVGVETEASIKAEVARYQFNKFTELNATSVGVRTALFKQFSDMNSARFGFSARETEYDTHELNADTFSASFELRQQLRLRFWLSEGFIYEKNRAKASEFTYGGPSFSVRTGYQFTAKTMAVISYTYLERKYNNGAKTTMRAPALDGRWKIAKGTDFFASFVHQTYQSTLAGSNAKDNVSSIGIVFYY
jgi:hypothetical protein